MSKIDELYTAIKTNDGNKIKQLLTGDQNLVEAIDETPPPIHWAIYNDKVDMVEVLLDHGADIERLDPDRNSTPLAYAIVYGRKDIIRLLVARGADLSSESDSGNMLDIAIKGANGGYEEYGDELASRETFQEIVEILREFGAQTDA